MPNKLFIFDLDGVIVDTAKFHFVAWQKIAHDLGIDVNETDNEQLKGVSRIASLNKILEKANKNLSEAEFEQLLNAKNEHYLSLIERLSKNDILPGVEVFVKHLKKQNLQVALGSASKNAKRILSALDILDWFDVIVDGNSVTAPKPNPEVFTTSADKLDIAYKNCIVFEDSIKGIQAANAAGMISIGIGDKATLQEAQRVFPNFEAIPANFISEYIH
ncbi:MAG: beta-phosphoglucomutase [Flavobacteriaceae bacterium]|nr:beta-phosphoglucomutase [Flavobacteriaceae bacterium]